MNTHFEKISKELNIPLKYVQATANLLDEGATVPFISRYRKELTGSQDEVSVAAIRDRIAQLRDLDKRRESIVKSITEQGKLNSDLQLKINKAETLAELEDIYLPYKPKRKTKASVAREKGLESLATTIFEQQNFDLANEGKKFISAEKDVKNIDEALAGARDIIAECINENAEIRSLTREFFFKKGTFKSKVIPGKEEEGQKYKDYFDWEEPISKAPSHRVLAMRRGEKELFLMLDILPPEEEAIELLENKLLKNQTAAAQQVKLAIKDSYKRLLRPGIETELRIATKIKADEEAIRVFAENLKQLLLAPPLGQKNILAIDPGFKSGCKVVCLDSQGKFLKYETIFPHEPQRKLHEASETIKKFVEKYSIEAIAIGNGTAGRETEGFVRSLNLPATISIVVVNESGASIYSASEVAREEFPDQDLTVRGAISIGRRLMDPLAELVKIDPKSIGVGQYQHDVDQTSLKQSLDDVVINCVNKVGVELNTSSKEILTYISGLGPQLAKNIVEYRETNGAFKNREALKKVPRMGDKAFEQAAGFLRIHGSENPLDSSAVHPESYHIIDKMVKDLGCNIMDLVQKQDLRKQLDLKKYTTESIGLPTLNDIMQELSKPGRDPREKFEAFQFAEGIEKIGDLRVGMKLPGLVTNITKFGAFVDIGVHQDGLVHISHIADRYVSDPAQVVKVQQKVMVTVLEVDAARKRIALSMKTDSAPKPAAEKKITKKTEPENMQAKLSELLGKFSK